VSRLETLHDPGHFGPKTFRHHQTGAEVSRQFGTSAEVSHGHFGTGPNCLDLQQTFFMIFATAGLA